MRMNLLRGTNRAIATGSVLLAVVTFGLTQAAQAQYGEGRYGRGGYGQGRYGQGRNQGRSGQGRDTRNRQDDQYTYGTIRFDWDLNGFSVRDRSSLETEIRRDLNADAGSRRVGRRSNSDGTLDVNVKFQRVNSNTVKVEVRLGLNQDGRGASAVTATESATTQSRDKNVDSQFVLQAFRKVRREFTAKVNQFARDNRSNRDDR